MCKNELYYILPMSGRGSRFLEKGYNVPKPLISIYGKPFFYWATRSITKFISVKSIIFVVLQEHINKFSIDKEILKYFPEANLCIIPEVTEGAVITCMKALNNVPLNAHILFNDCDHLFKSNAFNEFCAKSLLNEIDGALITFESSDPRYSFVGKDDAGNIVCTVEKKAISNEAICGCYYFKSREIFELCANEYLSKCQYSEYFMSGVYNVMLEYKKKLCTMKTDYHISFGTPEEYDKAKIMEQYKELL